MFKTCIKCTLSPLPYTASDIGKQLSLRLRGAFHVHTKGAIGSASFLYANLRSTSCRLTL